MDITLLLGYLGLGLMLACGNWQLLWYNNCS